MKIIAFAGPAGAGKTDSARYLIREHRFERVSFAAPLKQMLAVLGYPEPPNQAAKEEIIPDLGVSWRHMAQTLGTEWGRKLIHPDIWAMRTREFMRANPSNYVIDDLRFENEAAAIRSLGGQVIHIRGRRHEMSEATAGHESEKGIAVAVGDLCLENNGTLEEWFEQIDYVIKRWR